MVKSNENDTGGGLNMMTEMGRNRRALRAIDANIVAARPCPSAMHKRSASIDTKSVTTSNKNPRILARHRPITRKYSAQITSKQQQPLNEDDDDDDDVEMECVNEYPIADIDSPDKNDVFDVIEYVTDIHAFYKRIESLSCVPPDYMDLQPDINERMRSILIDWLIEVHYKFELMEETLYLTVNLIDRFLAVQPVARKKLQLVGVTAMLLACKYEEVSVPLVQDFISITDKAYSRNEVLQMERVMINTLEFNMSVPTPYVFVRRFLKAARSDKKLEWTSLFVIDLCLVDYQMLRFPPSQLAAAAVFTAQCTLTGGGGGGCSLDQWSRTCETHHSKEQLLECSKLMASLHRKAASGGRLTAVLRKYSAAKFGCVAKSAEPAVFLSDG